MDRLVISVTRRARPSEKLLRGVMVALAAVFLLLAVAGDRGMMLPCFLMAMGYFVYTHATRRLYEYILENGRMRIDRLLERGRVTQHEFSLKDVEILARPRDEAVAPFRKDGAVKLKKFDYTSYDDAVPYYTMIVREDGRRIKLLLDLNEAAIDRVRRENREAVRI
ncbi:MAG: hypothetical protein IJ769_12405 [Clostridia bacterium]|nr:hypothetical protein [Clostridia bacterium]